MYSFTIFKRFLFLYVNTLCWCVQDTNCFRYIFLYIKKCWRSKRLLCDINPLITMDDLKLIDSNIFIGYLANKDNVTV